MALIKKPFAKELFKATLAVLFYLFFVFVFAFIPLLAAFLYGVSLDSEINPTALNGMITASGVFLGFISAMAISKSELLDSTDYILIVAGFTFFFMATTQIFIAQIKNKLTVNELVWITGSLNANAMTAMLLINRLRRPSNLQKN